MSDKEALLQFQRNRVSSEMVQHIVEVTSSLIKVKPTKVYPSPPPSPAGLDGGEDLPLVSLYEFIRRLIHHSNVQTPTLMSTLVYLARLKTVLPSNVYGIESTRHRIFLGCLILAAKFLNDSSPINKHWATYTDGVLTIAEVNTIERELLEYLNWDLSITNEDLIRSQQRFLEPIKEQLQEQKKQQLLKRQQQHEKAITPVSNLRSMRSLNSLRPSISTSNSTASITSSIPSLMSASSSRSTLASLQSVDSSRSINRLVVSDTLDNDVPYYTPSLPLKVRNANEVNKKYISKSSKSMDLHSIGSIIPQIAVPQPSTGYV